MNKKQIVIVSSIIFVLILVFAAEGALRGRDRADNIYKSALSSSPVVSGTVKPEEEKISETPDQSEQTADRTEFSPLPEYTQKERKIEEPAAENLIEKTATAAPGVFETFGKEKDAGYLNSPSPQASVSAQAGKTEEKNSEETICTLSVRCDTILQNMDKLNPEKREIIPSDGVILSSREVVFYEGESVFNVLQRELKKNKIHMEFVNTPGLGSAYIEGIANIYEFDCGELSGWKYKVNGELIMYGSSQYILKDNDIVEWFYSCDLGRDLE